MRGPKRCSHLDFGAFEQAKKSDELAGITAKSALQVQAQDSGGKGHRQLLDGQSFKKPSRDSTAMGLDQMMAGERKAFSR